MLSIEPNLKSGTNRSMVKNMYGRGYQWGAKKNKGVQEHPTNGEDSERKEIYVLHAVRPQGGSKMYVTTFLEAMAVLMFIAGLVNEKKIIQWENRMIGKVRRCMKHGNDHY